MPRPPKARTVVSEPAYTLFKPAGVPARQLDEVLVTVDEFEALRLKDMVGWDQERCAAAMGISQSTLQRTLSAARTKVTEALVLGKAIRIEGGPVHFRPGGHQSGGGRGHGWQGGRGQGDQGGPGRRGHRGAQRQVLDPPTNQQ